jgi:hypothetical protein
MENFGVHYASSAYAAPGETVGADGPATLTGVRHRAGQRNWRSKMSRTYDLSMRRQPSRGARLALGAAAAAVAVLLVVALAACAGRSGAGPDSAGSATPPGGATAGGTESGIDSDTPGSGAIGGAGPGSGQDEEDDGGHDGGDDGGDDGGGLAGLVRYEVVRKEVTLAGGAFLRDTVACPAGTVALGGGVSVVGAGGGQEFQTVLHESTPGTVGGGAQSIWLVAVRNGGVPSHTVGIRAVCAEPPAGYHVATSDVALPVGGSVRSAAVCPAGTVVLGGGASVIGQGSSNFGTILQESAPSTVGGGAQSQWLVSIRNAGGEDRTVRLRAVCAEPLAGYQVVSHTVEVAADGYQRTTVLCPAGTAVLGGGASVVGAGSGPFPTALRESAPGQTGSPAQAAWLVSIRNGEFVNRNVGLRAVCVTAG